MGRTTVNLVGNCVATVVIARWENVFDYNKMDLFIKQCDAEKQDWKIPAPKKVICEKVTNSEIEDR